MTGQTDQTGQINTDNEAVALRRDRIERQTGRTQLIIHNHPIGRRAQTGQLIALHTAHTARVCSAGAFGSVVLELTISAEHGKVSTITAPKKERIY